MTSTRPHGIHHLPSVFGLTWLGQLVSSLGSGLTSFAVMVHVFQRSASLTQYSLASFFAFLPMVLLAPVAGALVDRWDRRRVMLLADLGAACAVFAMWLLAKAGDEGRWEVHGWHYYLPLATCSAFATFRNLAYSASTALMVPKQHLGRANGLIELALGVGQLISPGIAGVLVVRLGLPGILLIDLGSFVISALLLVSVRFPQLASHDLARKPGASLREDVLMGWAFIRERQGLLGMLSFITFANLFTILVTVLITPLVLSFADASRLGWVMSIAGVGMLAGGVMMGAWGGPRKRILGMLGFQLLSGLALFGAALPASPGMVAGAAFVFMFCVPVIAGCSHAIWQSKVPVGLQGRVFAVRRMVALSAPPLAALLAGPLADKLFEPWMSTDGALASSAGRILGTGPGRGIALLYVTLGVLSAINVLVAWLSPRVRNVEEDLPDALPGAPAAPKHGDEESGSGEVLHRVG
ncbi:MFS transporter [Myxococcus stipitatus]|uniref:MFS transporter n=1 Tax=Myxococcus stipitatus TaxID=83455 RepID=UPI001F3935F9|nr:MFS transporter [Myxococcus stipitatus]MCE9667442.1 MFS transporter [Myxococcus stipitatus]